MKNNIFQVILLVSILGNAGPSLAGSTESAHESATPIIVGGASIVSQLNQAIQTSSQLSDEAKHVNVAAKDNAIVITGTVPTDGDKQRINSIAEQTGATNVRNEIKVQGAHTNKHQPKTKTIKN